MGRKNDDGKEIKDVIGADTTVSIIKDFDKNLRLRKTYGHGSEILYDSFGLKMPEKIKSNTKMIWQISLKNKFLK